MSDTALIEHYFNCIELLLEAENYSDAREVRNMCMEAIEKHQIELLPAQTIKLAAFKSQLITEGS